MHFRLRSISMFFSLEPTSRYLISIALELLIEMTPRNCSLLKTLLVLRDRLVAISSMEFPASRDSTSWFSSAWLHRLLAMTGLGICESWCSASESFWISKRNVSGISSEKKFGLLKCQQLLFRFGIVHLNLPMQSADRYNLHGENSIYFDCFERQLMLWLVFKTPKRKDSLRLMSYKF